MLVESGFCLTSRTPRLRFPLPDLPSPPLVRHKTPRTVNRINDRPSTANRRLRAAPSSCPILLIFESAPLVIRTSRTRAEHHPHPLCTPFGRLSPPAVLAKPVGGSLAVYSDDNNDDGTAGSTDGEGEGLSTGEGRGGDSAGETLG